MSQKHQKILDLQTKNICWWWWKRDIIRPVGPGAPHVNKNCTVIATQSMNRKKNFLKM